MLSGLLRALRAPAPAGGGRLIPGGRGTPGSHVPLGTCSVLPEQVGGSLLQGMDQSPSLPLSLLCHRLWDRVHEFPSPPQTLNVGNALFQGSGSFPR